MMLVPKEHVEKLGDLSTPKQTMDQFWKSKPSNDWKTCLAGTMQRRNLFTAISFFFSLDKVALS